MSITSQPVAPATTGVQIDGAIQATFDTQDATGISNVRTLFEKKTYTFVFQVANAAGLTVELPLQVADFAFQVTAAKYLPSAAVTADNTNYQTLTLSKGDIVGGARTAIATRATTVAGGSWTARIPVPLTITTTAASVTSGQQLYLQFAPTGTGVATPSGTFVVEGFIATPA